jgi:fructooligosaccharide transport system substrate-binding protein
MNKRLLFGLCVIAMTVSAFAAYATGSAEGASGPAQVQKLSVWRPQNTDAIEAWWKQRIAQFNEKYAGKYEAVQATFPKGGAQGYEDKVNTAIVSNSLPDVMLVDGPNVSSYAANGIIIPLDKYVTPESKADITPSMLAQGTYNGKLYALALWDSSVALFYNKDMLAAAGISAPTKIQDAWTWDQFYDVATRLKASGRFGVTLHYQGGEQITYVYSPMLVQLKTDLISPDGSTATGYLNSARTIQFMSSLKKLYDNGIANRAPTPTEFMDQKSAMFLSGPWQIALLKSSYPNLNWGVTYYPKSNEGVIATPDGSWTVGVTNGAKNPAAAFVLADFMTNTEANVGGCPASGYLPSRLSSAKALPQYAQDPYRVFTDQLAYGAPRPRTPVYTTLSPQFSTAVQDVINGADPKAKLDGAAAIVDKEYQKNYAKK